MRRFFVYSCLLGIVVLLSNVAIAYALGYVDYSQSWQIDQRYQQLYNTPSPRLIIVGGSNNHYGVDNRLLADELGLPVVNASITAPLGAGILLAQTAAQARASDTVLLSLEYEHFYRRGYYGRGVSLRYVFGVRPEVVQYIRHPEQMKTLLIAHPGETRRWFRNWLKFDWHYRLDILQRQPVLPERTFDDDLNYNYLDERRDPEQIVPYRSPIHEYDAFVVEELNAFYQQMQARGVDVIMVYPPYPQEYAEETTKAQQLAYFQQQLDTNLLVPLVGTPSDYTQPIANFWDTVYHLAPEGRERRTRHLIEILRPRLSD